MTGKGAPLKANDNPGKQKHFIQPSTAAFEHFDMYVIAPGTYNPEKINLDNSPKYSFGLKTDLKKPNEVPGE